MTEATVPQSYAIKNVAKWEQSTKVTYASVSDISRRFFVKFWVKNYQHF
jgi:hypothetical protein